MNYSISHTQLEAELGLGQPLPVSGVLPTASLQPFIHFLSSTSLLRLSLLSSGSSEFSVVSMLLHACLLCSWTTLLHDNLGLVRNEGVPVAAHHPLSMMGPSSPPRTDLAQH